ncbi:MAG: hypothetical protein HYT08_04340 [Candidatus Levybacteria bacterium]|nr:hypothetical protein [Candidatus Levybacteria bacterium]
MEGSSEAPPSVKYRTGLNVGEFKERQAATEKPKQSLLAKARNVVLAGLGIAGAGAAAETTVHPAEHIADAVVQGAEGIKQAGERLVDLHNEDPAIRQKSEEIAGKLNGTIPLLEGEGIEKIKLVPAGATFEERQQMERDQTLINVRNYPGTNTPDGRFSTIIEQLPQGTIIEHAVLVKGGVPHPSNPTDTQDWWGFIYRKPGEDPNEPGKIGFAFGIYGEPVQAESAPPIPPTLE